MTRDAWRTLGRRISFWLVALGLGYVCWSEVWELRVVPGYREAEYQARHVAVWMDSLPGWACKP